MSCNFCGKDVDYNDTSLFLISCKTIRLREFEGISENESFICIECLKEQLK